jgi:hypothetical protein
VVLSFSFSFYFFFFFFFALICIGFYLLLTLPGPSSSSMTRLCHSLLRDYEPLLTKYAERPSCAQKGGNMCYWIHACDRHQHPRSLLHETAPHYGVIAPVPKIVPQIKPKPGQGPNGPPGLKGAVGAKGFSGPKGMTYVCFFFFFFCLFFVFFFVFFFSVLTPPS